MARYFETAQAIVERHGGTVEKFIGDAVMAVFGVPAVHEDDALRAVRAPRSRCVDALTTSSADRRRLRIGVNTGEVVTGNRGAARTGDAVNVAARSSRPPRPGEVLLGEGDLPARPGRGRGRAAPAARG